MNQINIYLSPELVMPGDLKDSVCVVTDILRATTCWVTGLAHGIRSIRPVSTLEECISWGKRGYITAGERGGSKIEELDLGNSPFEYTGDNVRGKSIVVSTTNGSQAVQKSLSARETYIGAFININAVAAKLKDKATVSIICSGWEGKPGFEDVVFAGELSALLSKTHECRDDAGLMAIEIYKKAETDRAGFLSQAMHVKRLMGLGLNKDIEYSFQKNLFDIVPVLINNEFVLS